ncbi:hypothetical protein [Xanthomonas vesicatoria]|uniref:Uncharacterized protein n=2 Tax=Xanthomonas vesicatoria TaxID=56460 RepID=A0AAJ0IX74_9XANT|nr:hypothetical protein [Xanthomonas vesicatoria]APO96579.1 hypothetical protein BI313_20140 [Xanthomonas vesicatoria]APP76676.1 hypothetical protein BJD12_17220 [Xanthomonas vesicatoria ATCC 35937]EGD08242.1 hypothetical protein XVE_3542 [Xanthomonas vesicatoria ATCC 35937]KHM91048.1 hypothetical protein OR60_20445 [Xanthomonas vesicatoria]KHM93158.1 hypothetical protein OR61_14790 [Xanthomonas vesicatoria]
MAKNSNKAREKLADSLMAMQASLFVNLTSIVLIAPIGFFGIAFYKGERLELTRVLGEQSQAALGAIFLLYLATLFFGMLGRHAAMKIYNELYPDT